MNTDRRIVLYVPPKPKDVRLMTDIELLEYAREQMFNGLRVPAYFFDDSKPMGSGVRFNQCGGIRFNLHGTRTGRFQSRNPACANPPREVMPPVAKTIKQV